MVRFVIADDEEKICQLICRLIDWNGAHMKIVGLVHNSIEAQELIKNFSRI